MVLLLSSTSTFLPHRLYNRASLTTLSIEFSMVFTNFPKYEELKREEQQLYHFDKDTYNKSARKGGKAFYFASSRHDWRDLGCVDRESLRKVAWKLFLSARRTRVRCDRGHDWVRHSRGFFLVLLIQNP
jgi:hypothetical protein